MPNSKTKSVLDLCKEVKITANKCERGDHEMYLIDDLITTLAKYVSNDTSVSEIAREIQSLLPADPGINTNCLASFL